MNIVFINDRAGFPNGMATTPRIRLYIKGLKFAGVSSHVLCTRYSELGGIPLNTQLKGEYEGMPFEYTTSTTIRPGTFLKRRQVELQGFWNAYRRLVDLKARHKIDCMYYYGDIMNFYPDQYLYSLFARLLHIPFVLELCERPWSLNPQYKNPLHISPLAGVNGAVSISKFLTDWVSEENRQRYYHVENVEIPILSDVEEFVPQPYPWESQSVLFAASKYHLRTAVFVMKAMERVWKEIPSSRLVLTGFTPDDLKTKNDPSIYERYLELSQKGQMETCGVLPRGALLEKFGQMNALLIPLFDDVLSKARFPTKIGEYALSGRPIVTSRVGEIPRFFTDQKNAFIASTDSADEFGDKILYALRNKAVANEVGMEGRKLALQAFDYRCYGDRMSKFFEDVVKKYSG